MSEYSRWVSGTAIFIRWRDRVLNLMRTVKEEETRTEFTSNLFGIRRLAQTVLGGCGAGDRDVERETLVGNV